MKKYNVVKDLNEIATKRAQAIVDESTTNIEEITSLLGEKDEKEMEMLKLFGTHEVLKNNLKSKDQKEKIITSRGNIVTGGDVKKICNKYLLRALPVRLYLKPIPKRVLNDLVKYKEKMTNANVNKNTHTGQHYAYKRVINHFNPANLFIVAPANHFSLKSRPKSDPVILYCKNIFSKDELEESDELEVVSTFGNDFTFLRLLKSFLARRWKSFALVLIFATKRAQAIVCRL